jgi:protoheme IX farnesyltransferase
VTDRVEWAPVVLFIAIFLWTPPHFWALAIKYADDYRAAAVPMLPAVAPVEVTSRRMTGYTVALWAATLVFGWVAELGALYWIAALVLGAVFTWGCVDLHRHPTVKRSMRLFAFSITYVSLLFCAMAIDTLVVHGV